MLFKLPVELPDEEVTLLLAELYCRLVDEWELRVVIFENVTGPTVMRVSAEGNILLFLPFDFSCAPPPLTISSVFIINNELEPSFRREDS